MSSQLWANLTSPSPLASLASSLLTVTVLAIIYVSVRWLLVGRGKKNQGFESLVGSLRAIDRNIVHYGSFFVGTRVARPWLRRCVVSIILGSVALASVLVPWPLGLWILFVGLVCIIIVYRHWSLEEDEAEREVMAQDKRIRINGDLALELVIACSFVFVFAPIAFAQMQAAGYGFEVDPKAGPFAFVNYTFIELLKAGSIVAYYDLYATSLHLERLGTISNPSFAAKGAVLVFRGTLDLIILAALKRLFDIARRVSAGLDLRPIDEALAQNKPERHRKALEDLKKFALEGRHGAVDRLEQTLTKRRLEPSVRVLAADALVSFAERRGETGKFLVVIDAYSKIARSEWARNAMPENWALLQNNIGIAYLKLAERETGAFNKTLSVADTAYNKARGVIGTTLEMDEVQWEHRSVDLLHGERLQSAAAAHRLALEVYSRAAMPELWAMTQYNLGAALQANQYGPPIEEAVAAYLAALEVFTREAMPENWAATQNKLGTALARLAELSRATSKDSPEEKARDSARSEAQLTEALAAYRAAQEVWSRAVTPEKWGLVQCNLGTALSSLSSLETLRPIPKDSPEKNALHQARSEAHRTEAVAAYRAALEVFSRTATPELWAMTQYYLAEELRYVEREEAVAAYRAAQEVWTRTTMPEKWTLAEFNIGDALKDVATFAQRREEGIKALTEAELAFRNVLKIFQDMGAQRSTEQVEHWLRSLEAVREKLRKVEN